MRVAAQAHVFGLHVRAHPTRLPREPAPAAERPPAGISFLRSRIALLALACLVAFVLGAAAAAVR
jgi:hypothetical protein